MSISFDALHQHAQSLDQRTRRDTTTPAVDPETSPAADPNWAARELE